MSTLKSSNDHLTLNADGTSKDIKFQADGVEKASISSAGAFTSTTIDATKLTGNLPAISGASLTGVADATKLPLTGGTMTGNLNLGDNNKVQLGASNDLALYHDGSNSYIKDAGSGALIFMSDTIHFKNYNGTEDMGIHIQDGATELYHNGSKKFETSNTGITVTGTCTATAFSGDGSALSNLPGGGKVLQVVQGTKTSASTFNSGSFTDIGLSVTITPSSSSSKILILGHLEIHGGSGVTSTSRLMRGSTAIDQGDSSGSRTRGSWGTGNQAGDIHAMSQGVGYLDSPGTTSATTYKVQGMGASTCYVNRTQADGNSNSRYRSTSNLIAMEIGA